MRLVGLLLLAIFFSACQGQRSIVPDVLREQRFVHCLHKDDPDRIISATTTADSLIRFINAGARYQPMGDFIYGEVAESKDTTILLRDINHVSVIRDESSTAGLTAIEVALGLAFVLLLIAAQALHGLSTI